MIAALTGLIAGAVHVWSGPDHLAAIAPLAALRSRRLWLAGVRWGLGHSAGVAVMGLLSLALRDLLPLETFFSGWGERLVGLTLIGIGLWALRAATRHGIHAHEHEHGGERHLHIHVHRHGHDDEPPVVHHRHLHAAFGVGTLHGLAGSSHFLGVLPVLAFPTKLQALSYLLAYAAGTILSMAAFSSVIGVVNQRWQANSAQLCRGMLGTTGVAALAIGVVWLFGGGF